MKHSKTKTEAQSTQTLKMKHLSKTKHSKTKHPNLENEETKNSKTKTPKLETGLSFINWLESLLLIQQESSTIMNRMQFKSTQVELRGAVNAFLHVLEVITKPRMPKLFLECYCMARKSQSGVSLARLIIKLIQDILSRNVQLNSLQAFIKPWDGFCRPLEVRTHPLPPPDSDCVMLDVKL